MRINKEGYKIIGISGVVCLLIWWFLLSVARKRCQ